jgi:hypothetical protein
VGRVWPRLGHCGRPLNLVVRGHPLAAAITRRMSAVATIGVVLAVVSWIVIFAAATLALGDPLGRSHEEMEYLFTRKARIVSLLIVLSVACALAATWISGFVLSVARIRSILTLSSCAAFGAVGTWYYVIENWK